MKKKLFILGMGFALLAVLAVPMDVSAATTSIVSGTMTATDGSITISVAPIALTPLNRSEWSTGNFTTAGTVTVVPPINGGKPVENYTVTAAGSKYMANTYSTNLTDPLLISPDGTVWSCADGVTTPLTSGVGTVGTGTFNNLSPSAFGSFYTVTNPVITRTFTCHAAQYVENTDVAGDYTDTLTFTAAIIPY